jgi:TRAP-type C4-dicarboxylate transport system permease small subunit
MLDKSRSRHPRSFIAVVGIAVAIMMSLLVFWPIVMRWIEDHIEWLD